MDNKNIALNFLPIKQNAFGFTIYRKEFADEKKEDVPAGATLYRNSLPISAEDTEKRKEYWISFEPKSDFEKFDCNQSYNNKLTLKWLFFLLLKKADKLREDKKLKYEKKEGFRKCLCFVLEESEEGNQLIWIEPYYLSIAKKFGFLIDSEFSKNPNIPYTRRIQQLSLSLDKDYRSNRNFYIDKYNKVKEFTDNYFVDLFPLHYEGKDLEVEKEFYSIEAGSLDTKKYIFANQHENNSQFIGLKQHGPLEKINGSVVFYFIFHEQERRFANELAEALRGSTYSHTFPGMEHIFKVPLISGGSGNVKSIIIHNLSETTSQEVIQKLNEIDCPNKVPILIIPSREDTESINTYYRTKHDFINNGIPLQVVTLDLLKNKESLKWSVSNIALQIFAKLGGKPWKVKPSNEKCLIIGIGQAHRKRKEIGEKRIEKFFSYSILTDSSGLYKDLKVIAESDNKNLYLAQLKDNIREIISNYKNEFDKFVVHTPFKIKKEEILAIKEVIETIKADNEYRGIEFLVLKINERNKFFGYNIEANSLVPYESTYVKLSQDEYLLWFEGLQYHNPNVSKRYSGPTHIQLYYASKNLAESEKIKYLQDIINLSGANWRGFNAKSLPVSIFYCQLVARFIREFCEHGYHVFKIDNRRPWFL